MATATATHRASIVVDAQSRCRSRQRVRGRPSSSSSSSRASASVSAATTDDKDDAKRELLRAVAALRRGNASARDVASAIKRVESFESNGDARGRWTLAYSANFDDDSNVKAAASPLESLGVSDEIVQEVTKTLYSVFFKFAPWLAGSAETNRTGARNVQLVDVDGGVVRNEVELDVASLPTLPMSTLTIGVDGEIETEDALARRAFVTFTSFDVQLRFARGEAKTPKVSIPLPRPRGSLNTTFCDDSMRISRGGRGGVFILTRLHG